MATIKELAQSAGISSRTLRHYDAIGLLKSTRLRANGYRVYGDDAVLRLQQIMLYKALDMPLLEIKRILDEPGFDILRALEHHKAQIARRIGQYTTLMATIDQTIQSLIGNSTMDNKRLFTGFTPEEEVAYANEAEQKYNPKLVRESNRKWKEYGPQKQQQILAEGGRIYQEMAKLIGEPHNSSQVQALVQAWREHMSYFWVPTLDQLVGLGQLYNQDERFKKNIDQFHPELAAFFLQAIEYYVTDHKQKGLS